MKIKIVAAIVDTRQLTLYKENGESIIIKQGDHRLRPILDAATPQIIAKGYAEIELADIQPPTGYQQFEKTSGVVRFFKVARDKLKKLFSDEPVENAAVGKVPAVSQPLPIDYAPMDKAVVEVSEALRGPTVPPQSVIDEIMAHAEPVSSDNFTTDGVKPQGNIVEANGKTDNQRDDTPTSHTIVAKVGNTLIPDMERIESHFARAAKLGNPTGVEKFLQRLAAVIGQRSHSVEDLLKFMERADMPIADDGSIIIYKVLKKKADHYVDCHTGNVPQRVGSYVCMDISLVDRNRNNECSNGLHVARRGYISGFSGDVCTICKLAPEDVITVPQYDANKMRVMGYHILVELPNELYKLLRQNKPITQTDEGKQLLGEVLAGRHIERIEEVRITKQGGGGVIVTPIQRQKEIVMPVAKVEPEVKPAEALDNPQTEKTDKPINPREVIKAVQGLSRKDQAQKLFKAYKKNPTQKNKDKLIKYKKSVKLGWKALGIDESEL